MFEKCVFDLLLLLLQIKEKGSKSLKEKLAAVKPLLEDLRMQRDERLKQFVDIRAQIEKMSGEISDNSDQLKQTMIDSLTLDEQDLTLRKLNEYQTRLNSLQKEKVREVCQYDFTLTKMKLRVLTHLLFLFLIQSDRLNKVLDYVNEVHTLCGVLGVDFGQTVSEIHPSLHRTNHEQSTNISDHTLDGLQDMIQKLKTERRVRFQKVDKHMSANAVLLFYVIDNSF